MKTYLFDTINRYKRWSEQLDMKAKLCNKSWLVFNDNGENEKLVFLENGTLVSSNNGVAIQGTWQFIAATQSLVILYDNKGYMTHPVFGDNSILILQLDGSNVCTFLLDENNSNKFLPSSIGDIKRYIEGQTESNSRKGKTAHANNNDVHYMDAPKLDTDSDYNNLYGDKEDESLNIPTTVYCTDNHILGFLCSVVYVIRNYHHKKYTGVILSPDGKTAKMQLVNGEGTTLEVYHPNGKIAAFVKLNRSKWGEAINSTFYNTYGIRIDADYFNSKFYPRYEAQIEAVFSIRLFDCEIFGWL